MKILLSGSSGLVGSAVLEKLFKDGHSITCLQRRKKSGSIWNTDIIKDTSFDIVIHLAGDNIASGRWTKKKKSSIRDSRIKGTTELINYFTSAPKQPRLFICASAVGFYGDRGDDILNEEEKKGEGFLADVCNEWEATAKLIDSKQTRTAHLRFGMILSHQGGALKKMMPTFKLGIAGKMGSGEQHLSWISMKDVVNVVSYVIDNDNLSGPINVVSPIGTTNSELTRTIYTNLGKKPFLPLPKVATHLIFGKEMAKEIFLASTRAVPEKLTIAGYNFIDKNLKVVIGDSVKLQ